MRRRGVVPGGHTLSLLRSPTTGSARAVTWQRLTQGNAGYSAGARCRSGASPHQKTGLSPYPLLICQLLTNSCKKLNYEDSAPLELRPPPLPPHRSSPALPITNHQSPITNHLSPLTSPHPWHVSRFVTWHGLRSPSGGRLQYGQRREHERRSPC
jgi:hypothetical protein